MGQLVANKPSFSPTEINKRLNHAMHQLADLCDRIDAGEDLDDLLLSTFATIQIEAKQYSDVAIAFEMACEAAIDQAKQMETYFKTRRKTIEGLKDRFRSGIKTTVEEVGDQLQLKGSLGTLSLRKQGPKAKYLCPIIPSVSVSSVVTAEVAEKFGISFDYITPVTVMRLEKARALRDLKDGKELPWAELITDETSLTVRKG